MKPDKKIVRLAPKGAWHVKAKNYALTMCWRRIPLGSEMMKHVCPDVTLCKVCEVKADGN